MNPKKRDIEYEKEIILNQIPKEHANAITLPDLCARVGMSKRMVKEVITLLRDEHPVCAQETNGGGYWIAESDEDVYAFIRMIERRKRGYDETIDKMRAHVDPFKKLQKDIKKRHADG